MLNEPKRARSWRRRVAGALFALHLMAPHAAHAADKDPLDYPLKQYAFLLSVALLGGLVSWITKVRKGEIAAWSLMALMGELFTSCFAGLLTFWACEAIGSPALVTAGMVGIAGHMGTKAIAQLERIAERKLNPLGVQTPAPPANPGDPQP